MVNMPRPSRHQGEWNTRPRSSGEIIHIFFIGSQHAKYQIQSLAMLSQKDIFTIEDCSEEKSRTNDPHTITVDKCRVSHVTIMRHSHDNHSPLSL